MKSRKQSNLWSSFTIVRRKGPLNDGTDYFAIIQLSVTLSASVLKSVFIHVNNGLTQTRVE
jgi:hypothetical protein